LSGSEVEAGLVTASFDNIISVVRNGLSSLPTLVENTSANIKATSETQLFSTQYSASSTDVTKVGNLFNVVTNILENGVSSLPTISENVDKRIKVSSVSQFTTSSSASDSDVEFISSSFAIVTTILQNGTGSLPTTTDYSASVTSSSTLAAYKLLIENIDFIQEETIAYLSSSWNGFDYDETKCKRDVGYIVSGAASDLYYNAVSQSVVNGVYYWLFPSQATGSQLNQTIDGINYASRLAQKLVKNQLFVSPSNSVSASHALLLDNKSFIQEETIAYLSSSWSTFDYNDVTCRRDVGYIVDAVRTDLLYGGNERSVVAGEYYYLYPSEATGSQLIQTLDGINYAKRLSEKVIQNIEFVTASVEVSSSFALLTSNREFIQNETIAYLSSSWSTHTYNETTCKRDVGYIVDAVATDLYYGGNERSREAGRFYYLYPSNATTSELEPTTTGIVYAKHLSEKIVNGETNFVSPSGVNNYIYNLLLDNKSFIQNEVVQFVNAKFPQHSYSEAKCLRDTGFIIDAIATDLRYGGNERSIEAGRFYYLYPSQATGYQLDETTSAIRYASDMVGLILTNTTIDEPQIISNVENSIRFTSTPQQFTGSLSGNQSDIEFVSTSIAIVSDIIENGLGSYTSSNYGSPSSDVNTLAAYEIIKENISFIQNETIAYLSSSWSTASYDETKCRRDVGYIVSGAAEDLLHGVVSASVVNGKFYYDFPSKAETIQLEQTLDGVNFASKLTQKLIQNVVFVTASVEVSASYALIRDNKEFIQSESIAYLSSSWSTHDYNQETCKRDIIYILDAVTTDLYYGGNERSAKAGEFYYKYPSQATGSQIEETTTGIKYAGDVAGKVAQSIEFVTASIERRAAWTLLRENVGFIQSESIEYLSSSWSEFDYNQSTCKRDIGYIVDAAATDVLYGGNERSREAGRFYYLYPSNATGSELSPTLDGIRYAGQMATEIIQNIEFVTASVELSQSVELLRNNKQFIQSESIAYLSSSWEGFDYIENTCKRDVGYIVDALSTDLLYGGNQRSRTAGDFYYKYPSQATSAQLEPTTNGINYAGQLATKVVENQIFVTASAERLAGNRVLLDNKDFIAGEVIQYVSSSWSGFDYNEASCSRDVGYILNSVATDFLYGGNERSREAGRLYYVYPSQATTTQLIQTIDGIVYSERLAEKVMANETFTTPSAEVSGAVELLRGNRSFIQNETIEYVSSSWSNVVYNEDKCRRDVGYIVDAAVTDLLYGGNERSVTAGLFYWRYPSRATVAGVPSEANQLDPTVDGIRFANGTAQNVVQNLEYTTPSTAVLNGIDLLRGNTTFIQKETIAYLSSSWSEFQYNEVSCSRDLGYIIDAVATDLKYGGNERAVQAGTFYYYIPSIATTEQKPQTNDGIDFAKGVSEKVIKQQQLVFPFLLNRNGANALKAAKKDLQAKGISYTNAAFPDFVYNEEKCYRDTGFIVDAIATDIIYGGNERAIRAAESYYTGVYGSAAVVITDQKYETAQTNRYLRTQFQFVARQGPVEEFGSLIITTGHDFSYAGAGVTYKALPPNQGGDGIPDPAKEVVEVAGGRVYFTSGNELGDFRIGGGLVIKQASGTLEGRTFSRSLFSLVTPFSLALQD